MVSITVQMNDKLYEQLHNFSWVNWSELAREKLMQREIFDRYIKSGKVTDEDWKFCESIDWHPVDELPMKEEFRKKIEKAKKEKPIRFKSVDELFKSIK